MQDRHLLNTFMAHFVITSWGDPTLSRTLSPALLLPSLPTRQQTILTNFLLTISDCGAGGAHPAGDVSCYEANLQDKKLAPVAHTIKLSDPILCIATPDPLCSSGFTSYQILSLSLDRNWSLSFVLINSIHKSHRLPPNNVSLAPHTPYLRINILTPQKLKTGLLLPWYSWAC